MRNTNLKTLTKVTFSAIFAAVAALSALTSCIHPLVFPVEPYLEFRQNILEYQRIGYNDSVLTLQVEFYFQDGDGDIGRTKDDVGYPYVGDSAHNLHFALYEITETDPADPAETDRVPVYLPDSAGTLYPLEYAYHLHYIEPVNSNGNLRGLIRWQVDDFPATAYMLKGRTVCYSIYLYDRALHKSNVIFTDPIKL